MLPGARFDPFGPSEPDRSGGLSPYHGGNRLDPFASVAGGGMLMDPRHVGFQGPMGHDPSAGLPSRLPR